MSLFVTAYASRTTVESIDILDADGALVTLEANDVIVIKIGRHENTSLRTIRSDAAASGGSTTTFTNPTTLTLDEDDLVPSIIKPGVYDMEVSVIDASDGNRVKHAENGIFSLISTIT